MVEVEVGQVCRERERQKTWTLTDKGGKKGGGEREKRKKRQ